MAIPLSQLHFMPFRAPSLHPARSRACSQGGWSPLLSTDLNWHPVEDLLGQTTRKGPEVRSPDKQMQGLLRKDRIPQHSPDAQPSMDLVALGARDVLQRSLSAVAAHYMQRAEWMPMACPAQPNFEGGPALKPAAFKPPPPPEPIMQQSHMWAVFPGASYAGSQPDSEEENVCIICLDRKPGGAALVPCGHTQLCLPCARALLGSIHGCPICRSPIQDLLEIRD